MKCLVHRTSQSSFLDGVANLPTGSFQETIHAALKARSANSSVAGIEFIDVRHDKINRLKPITPRLVGIYHSGVPNMSIWSGVAT